MKLLTREEFKKAVFYRDGNLCVFCFAPAVDAHHIIERRLWSDGGYYLDNGASVCSKCHLLCEQTEISVEEVRKACSIIDAVVPWHMDQNQIYDKWGNPLLSSGERGRGELFFDEGVQKILKNKLGLFSNRVKYPRTYHLPWSEGLTDDDRMLESLDSFIGKRVIVTEKMDGENTTFYNDYIHARSLDGNNHPSRNWVKNFWSTICYEIPEGWRVCGENLFAKHSIFYPALESYFYGFSIWNEKNMCLSWDATLVYLRLLDITPVRVMYDGIFDEEKIKVLHQKDDGFNLVQTEGYVVRLAESFVYEDFKKSVGKFVRKDHVQTGKHWMYDSEVQQNQLVLEID